MKTRTFCLAAATGVLCLLPIQASHAGMAFSVGISISNVSDFYEPLGAHGTWVEVADYGRCWRPARVGSDWRPYGVGHWEWTDCGWYWVSEEPWAWATYHYGRWVWDSHYGWLWVPDVVWGPSWVSWRGDGVYCGWAPLPPRRFCGHGGLVAWEHIRWAWRAFVFVEFGRFCEPIRHDHHHRPMVVNQTFINKTVNITNVRVVNNTTVVDNSPDVSMIRQHVGDRLQTRKAEELWRERSTRVIQRTSLDRAPAPPTVASPVRHERREERRDIEIIRPRATAKEAALPAGPSVTAPVRQERKEERREIQVVRPTPSVPVAQAERREPQWKQRTQPSIEQPVVAPRSLPVPSRSQEQRWQKLSSAPSQENRRPVQEQRPLVVKERPASSVDAAPGTTDNRAQGGRYGSATDDPSQRRLAHENRGKSQRSEESGRK